MISLEKENEYSVIIADLIRTLDGTESFILKIWIRGTEIPFEFNSHVCNFHFMQEGIRVVATNIPMIDWIFYDEISYVRILYEN